MAFPGEIQDWLSEHRFEKSGILSGWMIWHHPKVSVVPVSLSAYEKLPLKEGFQQRVFDDYPDTQVVFVWEDRWRHQKEIVLSRLESFLGLSRKEHGRQVKVIPLETPVLKTFLDDNHLLGATGGKFRYGLELKGQLIAAAVFGRGVQITRETGPSVSHELIRFCYKRQVHVRGGLSKLLQHFIREVQPGDIYTAVDREWSQGKGFQKLGFDISGVTPPIPFWVDKNGIRHREEVVGGTKIFNAGNVKLVKLL